ncbi:Acyl-CoA dehydrogenase type 2 domain protein [Cellulomonas flavigena DSM 20109]|uniref:Acyl-CoA dehydrogenase type 2 domain protein n=1 Tax=Cellulomonas flavigena (strain ATCC 482 / DSM 20109 / BCRC 11376 / JCM 18109 / NBRC 3775 / NCIMB 8073 / NRS 134) TaxID=446466 RepID=D5UDN6_CELFN|nr:acyl-CoA dehydrogenase family protein [Cellulomonas flavigena]ADG76492.1 Acyl-CoA dehydrogenase type 2 domain protein [Cellulomonas flavigena DSM 20109]
MTVAQPDAEAPPARAPFPRSAGEILARATAVAPLLRERSGDIEQARRLPADVVELLRGTGVFGMGFSKEWGGPGLSSVEQTEVIEALSYGDVAAGWCAMIGSDSGLYAQFLDEPVARAMFPRPDMVTAGLLFPAGRAEVVDGGYRLSGRWQFGSGITHADWVVSGAFLFRGGQPVPGPDGDPHDSKLFMVPRRDVQVVDTWHTTGLAGTGSCDYVIEDVLVPAERALTFDDVRSGSGVLAHPEVHMRNMPGVALGVARAALDHVTQVVATRPGGPSRRLADDYRTQVTIADCEADFAATRESTYGALRRQHEVLADRGDLAALTRRERAALPLSRRHAFRTARSIVTRLYDLMQTSSIYRPSPLDRWLRDTTTMCQHIVAQDRIAQSAGAHLLGGTPSFPLSLGITAQDRSPR